MISKEEWAHASGEAIEVWRMPGDIIRSGKYVVCRPGDYTEFWVEGAGYNSRLTGSFPTWEAAATACMLMFGGE